LRIVVDTNVFISGVFFSGVPYKILDAWRRGKVELLLSPEIFEEYRETGVELAAEFPEIDLGPWIELIAVEATLVEAPPLPKQVCTDPDDDKFLACAVAGKARIVVTGDKALLRASGYRGVTVLTPREFVDRYL
jgi:putative PIN family toxin of toxin-antitoxin system